MKRIPVSEFMDSKPHAVQPDTRLTELVRLFNEHRVRALPVTDNDGQLLGVVSETDLFLKKKGVPFSLEKVPSLLGQVVDKADVAQVDLCHRVTVGEVMTRKVIAVNEDDSLEDIAMMMFNRRLSVFPVVSDGRLTGVVRRINVLSSLYGERQAS